MTGRTNRIDLTEGSVSRKMLQFASPLFLSNLLQAVYNIVDMIVVGQVVGRVGLSAVAIGGDVLNLLTFIAMGFSNAGQVIIAQHIGAGRKEDTGRIIGTLLTFLLSAALILSVCAFVLRHVILRLLNTPQEAYTMALAYSTTCIFGLLFIYGYNMISAVLRGMGDSRHPFMFIATAALVNLVLDLLFIGVLHMAAFGAALATVIGQGVSCIWGFLFLIRNREKLGIRLQAQDIRLHKDILDILLGLGIPMAIKSAAIMISKLFVDSNINSYGVIASGAAGIEHKLNMISNLFNNAINVACSTMVGQNIGAEKYDRVSRTLATAGFITMGIAVSLSLILIIMPGALFRIFTQDTEVLAACGGMQFLLILLFAGGALRSPSNGLFDGSGNSKLNFAVALLDGIIARVGFALLFGRVLHMGWMGFLYGDAAAGFMPAVIAGIYYLSGRWKTNKYIIRA